MNIVQKFVFIGVNVESFISHFKEKTVIYFNTRKNVIALCLSKLIMNLH